MSAELLEAAPSSALAVYAHPDDPDVACGGALARWAQRGCAVHVVVCARGEKGTTDPAVAPDELAVRREGEMAAAGKFVAVASQQMLGYPDGELDRAPDLRRQIVEVVRRVRPEVVVCPDPEAVLFGQDYYNHSDHRAVGWSTLDAVAPMAAMPLYFPESGPPHQVATVYLTGSLTPDVWVDVSGTLEDKVRAVLCHVSQTGTGAEWVAQLLRRRAEDAGRQVGVRYAESFRRLRLQGP